MSFLRTKKNPLNRFFFTKFQEQVSKASGFAPIFTYEDFLKLVELQSKIETDKKQNETTDLTKVAKEDLSNTVATNLYKTWDSSA